MEWLWAFFGFVWTYLVGGAALWSWRAPDRWAERGFVNNGLGNTIVMNDNPRAFRWVSFQMKVFACLLAAMAVGGVIVTIGWVWKAL
ncbi:MAG: hypothetical protein RSE16_09830 [Sphingobium sp.]|nr:MAG: hypothetical protein RSE16_09830 [Sphingobium sp.]